MTRRALQNEIPPRLEASFTVNNPVTFQLPPGQVNGRVMLPQPLQYQPFHFIHTLGDDAAAEWIVMGVFVCLREIL